MRPKLATSKKTGATVLSRALEIKDGAVSPEGARFVLGLGIKEEEKKRMLDLRGSGSSGARRPLGSD